MGRPQLAIIADDLTGAADTAGGLAHGDMSVVLSLDRQPNHPIDVLSVSADTRDARREEVPDRVATAIARARHAGEPDCWYHKVDSAFRGHPGFEIALISMALAKPNVLICPALPSQGRTVIDGEILINGIPLHDTALGEGKTTSRIGDLVRDECAAPVSNVGIDVIRGSGTTLKAAIDSGFPGIVIVDAESDRDLQAIAGALSDLPGALPAGSAGLAAALATQLRPLAVESPAIQPHTLSKPILLVIGSAHEASAVQVRLASRGGMPVVRPAQLETVWSESEREALAADVRDAVASGQDTIVTYAGCTHSPLDPHLLASQLAAIALEPIQSRSIGGLVLTGGDIAAEVCKGIDAGYIWLCGEVAPAVPWGVIGDGPAEGIPVVTKAGSFGAPSILCDSIRLIRDLNR